jgi:hypothetical protein
MVYAGEWGAAPLKSGKDLCLPGDLEWSAWACSLRAALNCQVCARVVLSIRGEPSGELSPSPLLLRMFVSLAGGDLQGVLVAMTSNGLSRAFGFRQHLRLKVTHPLIPHFVLVALGDPSDAHRHSVI